MDDRSPESSLDFIFITNVPELAGYVEQVGVDYVMVDLESHGKIERQGGRDTVISGHQLSDVAMVKAALSRARLVVRVNPLHEGTSAEIDSCLSAGADLLMLPMFRSAQEVALFCNDVNGRAGVIPLVETTGAMRQLPRIARMDGVTRIHIGLNDLHLDLGMTFMFELLANGAVDQMADCCRLAEMPFGIGGVSLVGHGQVPGESVLGEHARLGSTAVILSRMFHQRAESLEELRRKIDFPSELNKLRRVFQSHLERSPDIIDQNRQQFFRSVSQFVARSA